MAQPRSVVPCAGCTLCCRRDALILHPEEGDDPGQYETTPTTHPFTGEPVLMLAHKPNGDCVYLDRATGCTIHERAPAICRSFDCRGLYRSLLENSTRKERREMIQRGVVSKGILEAGRKRLAAGDRGG